MVTDAARTDADQVKVFIPDETYLYSMEDESSETLSRNFRKGLEAEFQALFYEENVGPGFDIPAFGTVLEVGLAIGLFFQGATVIQGWDAWSSAYKRLHEFFHRKPILDRKAAAIVGINRLVHSLGKPPSRITLCGYSTESSFTAEGDTIEIPLEIGEAMPDLNLGTLSHVFNIMVDDKQYIVRVTGTTVDFHEIA